MPKPTLHLLLPYALPWLTRASTAAASRGWWQRWLTPEPAQWLKQQAPSVHNVIKHGCLIQSVQSPKGAWPKQYRNGHEHWLAQHWGVQQAPLPLAPYLLLADGGAPGDGDWVVAEPVHLQLRRTDLQVGNPAALQLMPDEALQLWDAAQPALQARGLTLEQPTPWRGYLRTDCVSFETLTQATPTEAQNTSLAQHLPKIPSFGQRVALQLQNEIQMVWAQHPVNLNRRQTQRPAVNSIWFYGQGQIEPLSKPHDLAQVYSDRLLTRGLTRQVGLPMANMPEHFFAHLVEHTNGNGVVLVEIDELESAWNLGQLDAMPWQKLEQRWFAPALQALAQQNIDRLLLTLTGPDRFLTWQLDRPRFCAFGTRRAFTVLQT